MRSTTRFTYVLPGLLTGLLMVMGCGDPESAAELTPAQLADGTQRAEAMAVSLPYDGTAMATVPGEGLSPSLTRPYKYKVPTGYDATKPTPLVILMHGLGSGGDSVSSYFGLAPLADSRTFLYAYPDGTKNFLGMRFWNATDYCCNLFGSSVDDVAYLTAVIDDMASRYNVDAKRIFLVGHSNGGFMAHRMACDRSSRLAGIVSLAGAQWKDASKCHPTDKVAVLQVHGTSDIVVSYNGALGYPGARDTVKTWALKNGCGGSLTVDGSLDLESALPGPETIVETYGGCPAAGAVELWSMQSGSHIPQFTSRWAGSIYDFLMAHPKP